MIAVEKYLDFHRRGQAFDVIMLDLDMPIMNGFEACQQIRKQDSGDDLQ